MEAKRERDDADDDALKNWKQKCAKQDAEERWRLEQLAAAKIMADKKDKMKKQIVSVCPSSQSSGASCADALPLGLYLFRSRRAPNIEHPMSGRSNVRAMSDVWKLYRKTQPNGKKSTKLSSKMREKLSRRW